MEDGPFEDVFPIENGDIPIAMLVYQRVSGRFLCFRGSPVVTLAPSNSHIS